MKSFNYTLLIGVLLVNLFVPLSENLGFIDISQRNSSRENLSISLVESNNGMIMGSVKDSATSEPIPFLKVLIIKDNEVISSTESDFDGKFKFDLAEGSYTLKVSGEDYHALWIENIIVWSERITFLQNLTMQQSDDSKDARIKREEYSMPLGCRDGTAKSSTLTKEDLERFKRINDSNIRN